MLENQIDVSYNEIRGGTPQKESAMNKQAERAFLACLAAVLLIISGLACNTITGRVALPATDSIRGSGNLATERREIGEVSRVELQGMGDLDVRFGESYALEITADDNLLEYLESVTTGNTLVIRTRENKNITPSEGIHYTLTAPFLEAAAILGMGDVSIPAMETDYLSLEISGMGDITIASLTAIELECRINGMGNINISSGAVERVILAINGSGDIDVGNVEGEQVDISIPGAGNVSAWATESLYVAIAGSGRVEYYGSPAEVSVSTPGSGSVNELGEK